MLFDAAALCWKSSGCCKDFKFMCWEEQDGTTANGYQTNIPTKSYRGIQVCSFRTIGKFGGCRQTPTQKIVSGSTLCRHDRGIWAKCADIWLLRWHVAGMSVTFSAKQNTTQSGRFLIIRFILAGIRNRNAQPRLWDIHFEQKYQCENTPWQQSLLSKMTNLKYGIVWIDEQRTVR